MAENNNTSAAIANAAKAAASAQAAGVGAAAAQLAAAKAKAEQAVQANVSVNLQQAIGYGPASGIVAPAISGAEEFFFGEEYLPEIVVTATKKVATGNKTLLFILGGCLIVLLIKKFVI